MKNLSALFAHIEQHQSTPFTWGEFDCCLFAADAVELMTGNDFAVDFRGKYNTKLGAARALKRYGQGDIISTVTAKLGEPKPVMLVKRGDVVLVDNNGDPALGICLGNCVSVVTAVGLCSLELSHIKKVWEVACHQ